MSNLIGSTVIVTGGASGIGRAIVDAVIAAGGSAVVWDVDAPGLERCIAKHGDRAKVHIVDVTDPASVVEAAKAAVSSGRAPTHLVNNAGIVGRRMRLTELDSDEVDRVLSVNIRGLLFCTRMYLEARVPHPSAAVLNLSSISARSGGMPGNAVYAATKGAIASFTTAAAKELAPEIRVNAIAPGVIDTAIQHDVFGDRGQVEENATFIPMQRPGTPEEVATAAVWLLSPAASYITGTVLDVDGGVLTPLWSPAGRRGAH